MKLMKEQEKLEIVSDQIISVTSGAIFQTILFQ